MIGITTIGTHIPTLRMRREVAVQAMSWYAPFLHAYSRGTRSVCNYDEDALTMAVAAGFRALANTPPVEALYLASTTLPFDARLSSAVAKTALGFSDHLVAADFTDSERAGITAIITATDRVARTGNPAMVIASDRRLARPGAPEELLFGDGAAAVTLGKENVIASIDGQYSLTRDIIDHYRGRGARFDYGWEERWTAAVGYERIVPEVVEGLLSTCGVSREDIDKYIYPCPSARTHGAIGRRLGVSAEKIADNLFEEIGETGTAHPLVMLARILETAVPGERIVLVGFGSGADAVLLTVTENIESSRPIGNSRPTIDICEYTRFLAFRELIVPEAGVKGEMTQKTALSVLSRERDMLTGLVGGKCDACGTPQFPKGEICVHPACRKPGTQVPYRFSHRTALLKTFTGDYLGPSLSPPNIYGLIQFDGGGRMMVELTDCSLEEVQVGSRLSMTFRKRYEDPERRFTGYFWKAIPISEVTP